MDGKCDTCDKAIAGGDDIAYKLPSPASSIHEQHHLRCLLAVEREACAGIADGYASKISVYPWVKTATDIADLIRNRA